MWTDKHIVKLIFGLKVKELRKQRGFSFAQLSKESGLSVSYLNEIEKGKKYPKADKIMALAASLDVSYDYLVSLRLSKKLSPVTDLLRSNFLSELPLELFGLEPAYVVELISNAPSKINAFISTLIEIARNFEMEQGDFYLAALRSYQELHDNYFPEIEEAAVSFLKETGLDAQPTVQKNALEAVLTDRYDYEIEKSSLANESNLSSIRSLYNATENKLYLQADLTETQEKFLIGRELAFNYLALKNRPAFTPFIKVSNFEEALNNFKASYFAVALLINKGYFIGDLEKLFAKATWTPSDFLKFLDRYQCSPEMFHQRLTNLLPRHFGIKNLFLMRFSSAHTTQDDYKVTKELHLSGLQSPHANGLNEHYCRRWISLAILKELDKKEPSGKQQLYTAAFQRSAYATSKKEYLCISMGRSNSPSPDNLSITTGILIDEKLKNKIKALESIPIRAVDKTCERCPLTDCNERAAPPIVLEKEKLDAEKEKAIARLSGKE